MVLLTNAQQLPMENTYINESLVSPDTPYFKSLSRENLKGIATSNSIIFHHPSPQMTKTSPFYFEKVVVVVVVKIAVNYICVSSLNNMEGVNSVIFAIQILKNVVC